MQILEHTTHATAIEAYLKFTCDPSDVTNNHYEAIVLINTLQIVIQKRRLL